MNWNTHDVSNVVPELKDYNLYGTDSALQEAIARAGAQGYTPDLRDYGAQLGSEATLRMADNANRFGPELEIFDRVGNRVDRFKFHPDWHSILTMMRERDLVSMPFSNPRPGAWAAWAANFSMHSQIEAGSLCPVSMTFGCIPLLQREPALFDQLAPKLYSREYDARDLPWQQKKSVLIGMGMTEKQGGSDVRANTTRAVAVRGEGRGGEYHLVGHKWFFSAPMCDAHLVVARTVNGLSCFFVPRWRPDGSKNAIHIQRAKDKLGNRSNSGSEVEFRDAWGVMMGEEGAGIRTIIEMANFTRLHCVLGSSGLIRQALVQAMHYTRWRSAFGKRLCDQPLMQNVLADMALESEAATQLMMRLTEAFAQAHEDPLQRAFKRIVTPAGKFWVCKRAVELGGEAMEVFGGNGYVEEAPMARLYREMPVNSIWEGSGNVMALDVQRAIGREPEAMLALLDDVAPRIADEPRLKAQRDALLADLKRPAEEQEVLARRMAQRLVLLLQADLLRQHSPDFMADAFIASRMDPDNGRVFGTLGLAASRQRIIDRAWAA